MARVNDAKVRNIRPSDSIDDYTPFIETATIIVDDLSASCGSSFSEAKLAQIELWLSAHYASAQDPTVVRERFEQDEATYQSGNRQLFGVMSDKYGQTANMLANGCLVEFEKRKFSITVTGFVYDDE